MILLQNGKRIFKIDQNLAKSWTRVFLRHLLKLNSQSNEQ